VCGDEGQARIDEDAEFVTILIGARALHILLGTDLLSSAHILFGMHLLSSAASALFFSSTPDSLATNVCLSTVVTLSLSFLVSSSCLLLLAKPALSALRSERNKT
jgi:hypothetical protein